MTNPIPYDGTGKLGDALAALHGISAKSHNKIAELISKAKAGLSIDSKAKRLPADAKLAIYRYHYERLNPVTDSVADNVETFSQSNDSSLVEINSQNDKAGNVEIFSQGKEAQAVEVISQSESIEDVDIISQNVLTDTVAINSQPESVEIILQTSSNQPVEYISHSVPGKSVETISQLALSPSVDLFSQTRVAFYVQKAGQRSRQVIALEGYYLNALAALGVSKADVPKWVQAAVDNWAAFAPDLPITRQVKCLIVRELTYAPRR